MIRPCTASDVEAIWAIVNDAAQAYKGVIPADRWHDPYMPKAELQAAIDSGVEFWGFEMDSGLFGVMFYQKHGFRLVTPEEKDRLLPMYWGVPRRQIETSVVLGDRRWFSAVQPGSL